VQAGKLATLGELTTGVAHEPINPLNNIGLFIGNAIDLIELGIADTNPERILHELHNAMQQARKATEIISHLRTFGRAAPMSYEPVVIEQVVHRALSLRQDSSNASLIHSSPLRKWVQGQAWVFPSPTV
jgi:C4-dicarboxylate-specific signal transduction histidine kinase